MKNNIKAVCEVFKELKYLFGKRYKKQLIGITMLIIIGSFLELLGVYVIMPFIQAILQPDQLMGNQYIHKFVEFFAIESSRDLILLIGIGIIVLYITKNLFMIFSNYAQCSFATTVQKELSVRMLASYMRHPYTYFLNVNSAEILRCCNNDIQNVYRILAGIMTMTAEMLNIAVIAVFLLKTDFFISIGVLTLMLIVMLGFILELKPAIKRCAEKNIMALTQTTKTVSQAVNGIKEIFVMQRRQEFITEYENAAERYRKSRRKYEFINGCPDRIVEGVCISGIIGVVCIRLSMDMDMVLFVPKLGAFAMAAFKLFPSIGKIVNRINEIIFYWPQLHSCYENALEADRYTRTDVYEESENSACVINFQSELTINHIKWQYPNQLKPTLIDVSMKICKGEAVAFIGESGTGKTTLSDCILGLLRPQKGTIEMDGIDVYTMPKQWGRIVGYVPQMIFMTDDTIRNNIIFGLKDGDDGDIWEALERAQLKSFVQSLPDGLNTIVGERGIKFSGGQKQRLAIARALYNKPEILILDEATAALDNDTEAAVMESIDALQGQITMIIVAHRLSTIRNCDKIYEIKDGCVYCRDKADVLKNS